MHGQKEARSAHIGGSLAHVGTESPLVHARAMSVSLSPEDSPAMRAGPRAPTPLSPFSPVTCTDIMRPSLRDAQGASPTAYGHGGVLVRAHASSRSPSPNESNFHSPDTLFYRYSPAAEMPPPHLSDRTEVSPSSATGGIRPPAPHFSSHKDPDASTFSLDSPISVGSQRNSHEGLSGTTVGTLHVEIVQCRNLPQTFGAHPCVYCCASLHESGQWGNVHVLSQLDKPVSETRVHPLSLTAHLLCPQHTTQSAGVSQDLEFRDSFTLDRAYALGPFRAQGDGSLVGGPMPVLASLNHRTVDLLITLHDTASQRKEIMSMAALKVKQGAAVDQWFNLFDHDGHRQTDVHGGSSAIRVSVYFAEQGIFRGSTSPLLLQDVSPPRDARRVHVHGASSVGTARANDAAQPVDVQEISLQPPPARTPSASADSRRLVEIVIGIQAKMRRTMVSRWYSAMLIRFSKVITNMPRIEVQSEVRKPPTALPGGYTELPSLVESPDLPPALPAGRAHMPTAFEPEPVHSIRPREPRVVQMRIMDKQPQQNGNHYVPENTSDDAVNAHSGINLPHGNMHKSPTSDTSSRLLTRQHKRSVSPASSSGPWNDRKFIEAEAFAKLARRLKESGYQEQAQMYCGEAWNLLQQLKADEDVGGQYNCVALILNEVERDMSLYTSNASFGSSLNYSLNLDPYSSTLTGPAARKTNVADAGPYKAANASSPDAGLTSAITPQPAKKFEERRRRESEVRDSWNRMGKAMENISDALENYAKQTATQQAATPMDAFKSVRKLPAAEAAALMRQRLGEPVWSPVPSTDSALQLTVAGDIGAAPSNSRSKLMELEETVRLQMRSGQRMSKRQVFEDAANLRRYGDRSASKWGPSDQTQSTTAPHSDDDILSSTSADDNVATLGSHVTPSHDLEVGRGGRGNKDSGNGDHNGVQRVISYGRSPALDEVRVRAPARFAMRSLSLRSGISQFTLRSVRLCGGISQFTL